MAQEGYAGFSSGVPSTQGMGQGAAQVFQPQARQLDTSSLEQGMYNIAGAYERNQAAKKAAEAARKKEQAKVAAEAQKLADGEFKVYQDAMKKQEEDFFNGLTKATAEGRENEYLADFTRERNNYLAAEKRAQDAMSAYFKDPNKVVVDPETGETVSAFQYFGKKLNRDLSEDDLEMMQEGSWTQMMDNEYLDVNKQIMTKDPEFSLEETVLDRFKNWQGMSEETKAKIQSLNGQYDLKTLETIMPQEEYDKFIQSMKNDPMVMEKWSEQEAIRNGIPKNYLLSGRQAINQDGGINPVTGEGGPIIREEKAPVQAEYEKAIESVLLPTVRKETKSIVQAPKEDTGDGGAPTGAARFELSTVTVSETPEGQKEPVATDYKVWGAGDETINGVKVSGVVFKDGKLVPNTVDQGIVDDESLAIGYINKKNASFDKGEKVTQQEVIDLLKESKSEERGFDEAKFEAVDKAIDNFGGLGDNEEGLYKRLSKEFGFDFKNDDAFAEFRDLVEDSDFDDEKDRTKMIRWLKTNLPTISTRANQAEAAPANPFEE